VTRDFLSIDDLTPAAVHDLLDLAAKVKASPPDFASHLAGRTVAVIFEKPSSRMWVSFEVAVMSMGGHPVTVSAHELRPELGEPIEDIGRALSRYVDAIVFRTFGQERLEGLARGASVPVVNALSDFEHPCQCVADLFTIRERRGELAGTVLAYLGDGNNVSHSLLLGGASAGMDVRVATPLGFGPIPQVVRRAEEIGRATGGRVTITNDPGRAARGADVLYTDVWASMGQEQEAMERRLLLQPYQLNEAAIAGASPDVLVMHCLPARRGEEISDEAIDGPHSVVWEQSENCLHTEKALLLTVLDLA
jgi:ornithine carbamoyltransferase